MAKEAEITKTATCSCFPSFSPAAPFSCLPPSTSSPRPFEIHAERDFRALSAKESADGCSPAKRPEDASLLSSVPEEKSAVGRLAARAAAPGAAGMAVPLLLLLMLLLLLRPSA